MTGSILTALVIHLVLTALPALACAVFAARQGVRSLPVLLAIALAGSATSAYLVFWAFYAAPTVGESLAFLVVFGAVAALVACLRGGRVPTVTLRGLAIPFGLWALASAFLVFLGFAHGASDAPMFMAGSRFSGPLPSDNDIPRFFADWYFANGHATPPVFPGEWLSSDRPPLQVGYVLSQRPFAWSDDGVNYQVLGVVLQQLWVIGLWAVLLAAGLGRRTRALALIAVLLSHVAIVNGFFVWPKLLPAALILAAAALLLTPLWSGARRDPRIGALVAALVALAFLGHGSSAFAILPLALVAALRGLPDLRWVGAFLLVGLVLVAPWLAYQRYADPPGDRLTKWSLAGVVAVDERSTPEALLDSYREAGLGGVLHNKGQNFVTVTGGGLTWDYTKLGVEAIFRGSFSEGFAALRLVGFMYLLPSIGLFLLGPVAMLVARRRAERRSTEWRFALAALGFAALATFVWCLLMFGTPPARPAIHVGSMAVPILAICGCVAGLRAAAPRLALYVVPFTALATLVLYVPSLTPIPGTSYSAPALILSAASLLGLIALLLRGQGSATADSLAR